MLNKATPKKCDTCTQLTFSITYVNCQNISILVKFEVNSVCKNLYCFASVAELERTNIIINKQFHMPLALL